MASYVFVLVLHDNFTHYKLMTKERILKSMKTNDKKDVQENENRPDLEFAHHKS